MGTRLLSRWGFAGSFSLILHPSGSPHSHDFIINDSYLEERTPTYSLSQDHRAKPQNLTSQAPLHHHPNSLPSPSIVPPLPFPNLLPPPSSPPSLPLFPSLPRPSMPYYPRSSITFIYFIQNLLACTPTIGTPCSTQLPDSPVDVKRSAPFADRGGASGEPRSN